jgi:hypothetical protein
MREHVQSLIEDEQKHIQVLERRLTEHRRFVNLLCAKGGVPPLYADAEAETTRVVNPVRADEYYGQPLAKALRTVLERRRTASSGPASVAEFTVRWLWRMQV